MKKYYGNKETKVVHSSARNDACRREEIKRENRVGFDSLKAAEAEGYRPCGVCVKSDE